MRPTELLVLLPILFSLTFAQDRQPRAQRKDSATVSPGISKEQLALEAKVSQALSWIAGTRRTIPEKLEYMRAVPALIKPLCEASRSA
jgi:hypothetical protein